MSLLFRSRAFLSYWLEAVDEHSLHAPFFFDFYTRIVKCSRHADQSIETLRRKYLNDHSSIVVNDLGSRGAAEPTTRRIADIARKSLSPVKYSQLYQNIVKAFACKTMIELGTSLGINTLYLSSEPNTCVYTFEGAESIAELAADNFKLMGRSNIRLIRGDISTVLEPALSRVEQIDFALIDANHTMKATLNYFEHIARKAHSKSVVVIDDIHWSREMELAWEEVKDHATVYSSIDLFRCGIVFFTPQPYKQHVVLQY